MTKIVIEFTDLNPKKVSKFTRNLFGKIANEWIFIQDDLFLL